MLKGRLWLRLRRVRLLGSLTLAAVLLMGAFAGVAHAANPVSGLTVDPLTPSDAGGARTDYVIHFSTSATGALGEGQHITITFPTGSNTTTIVKTVVTDAGAQVGTCGVSSQTVEVCTIASGKTVAAGDQVTVELDGVTNPPQNPTGGQQQLLVVTDTDTVTASTFYTVGPAGSISTPSVVNSSPSTAAGARTDYVITFNTSGTGGMSGTAHSQVTITFPGTATSPFNTTTIVNAIVTDTTTSTQVGTCGVSSQTVEVCTISAGKTVTAGDTLKVELDGVTTESPAPAKLADLLTVSTTSDVNTTTSNPYPVASASAISTPSVVNSSPSTAAGARTDYVITFNTSSTGGMSGTAHSQITITFPGTATSPFNTTTIVNAIVTDTTTSTQVGTCGVSSQTVEVCTISAGKTVTAGDTLIVELDGVTTESPAPAKLADLLTVSTSSDATTKTSSSYPVANAGSITTPSVVNSSPSTAAGARTDYVITFNTSGTGGMSGTAHSQVTITFPGTATSPFNTTTIVNAIVTDTTTSTQVGTCGVSSQTVEVCTIAAGKTVTAGDVLTIELDGVTTESPAPNGNLDTLTVSTTSDATTKTSSSYPVANAKEISAPRVDNTSPSNAAGARTDYVMTFTTSSTGGLSGAAHSQITITFPGTATSPFNTTTIVNAIVTDTTTSTQVGTCGVSSQTVEVCTIAAGKTVTAGDVLTIELDGVTTESPAPNGNLHTLTVSTTSDATTMTSVTYGVANSGSISAPTVQLSNFTAGAHANYTIAFNTSASGGMSGTAHSQITITLPATSSTLSVTNAVVMDAGVQVGTCGVSSQIVEVCTISAGETVNPGDQLTVALSGVTNPSNVSVSSTLTVQTTSDVISATSGPYQGSGPQPPTITAISPSSGPASGGAGVMITGTNLTGATAVDFGANGATNVTVVDSSHITATSPPGSATVDVTVTTPGGTSTTSAADQYTYIAAPTVTSVNPSAGPTAGGTTVTITGTNLTGANGVSFGSTAATSFTINGANSVTATAPAENAGTVNITVTTPGGISTTSGADQYTYTTGPTVTSVAPTAGPLGGGTSVTITGANLTGATAVRFGTTNATTFTVNSATSITATAPAESAGTVGITVTSSGGTSPTSTADQYTYTARPTVTQVAPTAGPTGGGTSVTITGTNLTGATAVSFGSTTATSFTVSSATSITAVAPAGSAGTVDVTVTTPGGTSGTSAADRFTYNAPQPSSPPPASPPPSPPVVSGGSPTTETVSGAAVSGTVNPESLATTAFFQYGLDPSDRGPGASTTLYDQSTPMQQVGADSASHTVSVSLTGLVPGALYHVRLVATNSDGTTFGTDQTFTTPQAPAPAPPVLGKTQDAAPVTGTVFIRSPSGAFVLLTGAEQIPSGAEIDALHGSLKITTATAKKGKTQQGVFGGAVFTLTQTRGGASKGLATLSLVEGAFSGAPSFALCKPHKALDATAASSRTLQLLHASAHGKFRTKGRYSAATVLGTKWTIADRCDGTLVHDITDSVAVTDFVHHKTIIIHAGQSYFAKAGLGHR